MQSPKLISWTSTIASLIRSGHAELGLREFFLMCNSGLRPNEFGFSLALKASRVAGELTCGKLLHGCTIKSGFECNAFCSTSVLDMHIKCGNMKDACSFFETAPYKCQALWNTMIDGYARISGAKEAVELFHQMRVSSNVPNSYTYTILIKLWAGIGDIDILRFFHGRTIKAGFDEDNFVGGALVDSYAKWGELTDACRAFWSIDECDHVVWSALLAGLCHNGDTKQGLDLYLKFVSEGRRLDPFLFASVFNLCSDLETPLLGLQVHACLAKSGFVVDSFIGSALIDMYFIFGMVTDAYRTFLDTIDKNEMIFSAMIHGSLCNSDHRSAVEFISQMRKLKLVPDYCTLNCMLRAYSSPEMLEEGRVIHGQVIKSIAEYDLFTGNTLIEMYSKCRAIDEAVKVFMVINMCNEFSWTALITGYIESERCEEALVMFHRMHSLGSVQPSEYTLVAVLRATAKLPEFCKGKQVHGYIIKLGFHSHAYIEAALISMYAKCGCMDEAYQIFSSMSQRDPVSWSTMMAAYVQHGHCEKVLKLFLEHQDGFITVDEFIVSSCLSACSSLTAVEMGRCLHVISIKTGLESNLHVVGAIVDMYCRCGFIDDGQKFFDKAKERNVKSYTALISGYAHHGLGQEALHLFHEMLSAGVKPDGVTYVGVLSACSHFGLVKEGWHYFESMWQDHRLERTINHYACMVDLLGREGSVKEAEELINMAPFKSKTLLWRTLLGACSKHGNIEVGNRIAEKLIELEPDEPSTYVLLSNIYASASMWDRSIELQNKIKEGGMKKSPGHSWIEVAKRLPSQFFTAM
ncbi:pentatricopeptide repeat-containing protein At2g33680-like isoform X1 [Elaeis guineensis]|uniref:pentatricopeptide repeat-containing protein At2g33680-like isoform X1 n=1 Tax=Elaeis guineensis var. tenera TaxID=51953 RepID=UPI003C6D7CE9